MKGAMKQTILIVEDEFLIRMMLADTLADEGFEVLEAADAAEATAALNAHPSVALMMTDLHLPGRMDGRELSRVARAINADLPIIFMTGRPDAIEPSGHRLEAIVSKPYLPSEIAAVAKRLLALAV